MLDEMDGDGWLTELPLVHLMPAIAARLARNQGHWRLLDAAADGDVVRVHVEWTAPSGNLRDLRAEVFALLGSIAEGATYVEQRMDGDAVIYDVATGQHEDEMRAHGHVVSLRVTGPAVAAAALGARRPAP